MLRTRTIAQRELRNDIGRVLREAEAGTQFTVTVRGRPVARVMPLHDVPVPRTDVPWDEALRRLPPADPDWLRDLFEMRAADPPVEEPRG